MEQSDFFLYLEITPVGTVGFWLVLTLITFPLPLCHSSNCPSYINDAIGAETDVHRRLMGMSFSQVQFLMLLCLPICFAVLIPRSR